jgi:hypothetical protein
MLAATLPNILMLRNDRNAVSRRSSNRPSCRGCNRPGPGSGVRGRNREPIRLPGRRSPPANATRPDQLSRAKSV